MSPARRWRRPLGRFARAELWSGGQGFAEGEEVAVVVRSEGLGLEKTDAAPAHALSAAGGAAEGERERVAVASVMEARSLGRTTLVHMSLPAPQGSGDAGLPPPRQSAGLLRRRPWRARALAGARGAELRLPGLRGGGRRPARHALRRLWGRRGRRRQRRLKCRAPNPRIRGLSCRGLPPACAPSQEPPSEGPQGPLWAPRGPHNILRQEPPSP